MKRPAQLVGSLMLAVLVAGQVACEGPMAADDSFPEVHDTQDTKGNRPTTPQQALKSLQVPPGFAATLFAGEPDVRQPIGLATDSRGRLWVAENYTYAERGVNFDESLRDRIVILEDIDHDGEFDRRTVFWDQANKLTSIEIGFGGVWALCAPQLLFIPDRDGDDRPDGPPEVVLDGWDDDRVRHNIVNGLRWGPDGWLYGRHGILATSHVGRPGDAPHLRQQINCGIWRFHPLRRKFEVVAHGTTNPWGMDWDRNGQLFFINTVIGHLWHVVPGAHYRRMYGQHFNEHIYEVLPQTADHYHWHTAEAWNDIRKGITGKTDAAGGGHAHSGLVIYQGGSWPEDYRDSVLSINLHGQRINRDRLERKGSGYVARHAADFSRSRDPWFRGVELVGDADGGLLIADWSDIGECHENDGVHRSTGRIYRVSSKSPGAGKQRTGDVAKMSGEELVALHRHANVWYPRKARRVLQQRAAAGVDSTAARDGLLQLYQSTAPPHIRLRAMWSLYGLGALKEAWLLDQLDDPNEHIRVWAIKLLVDVGSPSPAAQTRLIELAKQDKSGLVLQFLAAALPKLSPQNRWRLAGTLGSHAQFAGDPFLPLMIWYGTEPEVAARPDAAVKLVAGSRLPRLTRLVARRVTGLLDQQPAAVDELVTLLLDDDARRKDILGGMSAALEGWRRAPKPRKWSQVVKKLNDDGDAAVRQYVQSLSAAFGDGFALEKLRRLALDGRADIAARRNAIRSLVTSRGTGVVETLQKLAGDRDLSAPALRGLAAFNHPRTPKLLVDNFPRLHAEARAEAINTLVSRPNYAELLLKAVESKKIDRAYVSPFQIRQMHSFGNYRLSDRLRKMWPELRHSSKDKAKKIAEYRERLTADHLKAADLARGRVIFTRSCATCHKLFGEGGSVGPELTGAQRNNLNYLLENIVDPSLQLAANYRMSILFLEDGRVLNGVVGPTTARTMTVQTPTQRIVLQKDDVEDVHQSKLSMMPERLLDVLKEDEVRDLIGYLMSPKQVPLPSGN